MAIYRVREYVPENQPYVDLFDRQLTQEQAGAGELSATPKDLIPLSLFPQGQAGAGMVPPTLEARCSPAKSADKHRGCRLPPQEGCRPLVHPLRALSWMSLRR